MLERITFQLLKNFNRNLHENIKIFRPTAQNSHHILSNLMKNLEQYARNRRKTQNEVENRNLYKPQLEQYTHTMADIYSKMKHITQSITTNFLCIKEHTH